MKATFVLSLPIEKASAKICTGNPVDDKADYELETWAGVIPFSLTAGEPVTDARLKEAIEIPDCVADYRQSGSEGNRNLRNRFVIIKVGLIGDYSPEAAAHVAIPKALSLAAAEAECEVQENWLATETLAENLHQLSDFDGLWCVPASPYKSMDGALAAIRFARERGVPLLGTCGGFQHAVIEYVRNVLGFTSSNIAE